jgi:hypothetical protein
MSDPGRTSTDAIAILREDFRRRLEIFYARLQLAPPYDTVEKAIGSLSDALKTMPAEARTRLLADHTLQWAQYRKAFVESGLHLKHRGIIAGLVRTGRGAELPAEYRTLLDTFLSS